MLSLRLFNSVLLPTSPAPAPAPKGIERVEDTLPLGYIVAPSAAHLSQEIVSYYEQENLDGNQLNQTFHKSWATVQNSSRAELLAHQLTHYFSTYGLEALGIESDFIYLPDEVSEVPELKKTPVRIIRGLSADALAERVYGLVNSGVALADETLNDLLQLLVEIDRLPETTAGVRNREFAILLSDRYDILPDTPVEFLRFLVFKATGEALLIKDKATISAIKASDFDPTPWIARFGPERAAQVFRRFKPLWLAFKRTQGQAEGGPSDKLRQLFTPTIGTEVSAMINRLNKLAQTHHRPLPEDYLNTVTARDTIDADELKAALDKANAFRKIRLLYALNTRLGGGEFLMYRIRNGRSYVQPAKPPRGRAKQWKKAYKIVYDHLAGGLDVRGKTFLMSKGVHLALPATEKMFVGPMPVGSFVSLPDALTVGIYWRNEWGARDLDLSATALSKVGWNASYNENGVTYSGDITNAPDGATELLRFGQDVTDPYLVQVNVFSGRSDTQFKVFVGRSDEVKENYMLRPDELKAEVKLTTNLRQQIIGLVVPHPKGNRFVFCNVGAGNRAVAGVQQAPRLALVNQFAKAPNLENLLVAAGAKVTRNLADAYDTDLRWEALAKDSVLALFAEEVAV